ncbi:MAG: suppressor of fused domain protein [Kofleriaceae bacterium]
MDLELTVVQPPTDLGFIAAFAITDQMIHIAGGTSAIAPTLLASSNARHFERQRAPRELGLRDIQVIGDAVWVCGEYGQLAVSRDRGTTWQLIDTSTDVCLHAIRQTSDGIWVVGDRGFAARVVDAQLEKIDLETTVKLCGVVAVKNEVVVLGADGALRRWKAGKITLAATGSAKAINAFAVTKRGTWVVAGDGGFVSRSPDGAWWTRVKTEVDGDLEALALWGDRVVVVGDRGQILISVDDGRNWDVRPGDPETHLWSVAPFGEGLLIGGDRGLIVKLAQPGDRTWEDRVNVFGGAKALDLEFAAGPNQFITKYLAQVTGRDAPNASHTDAFATAYGMAPPLDVAAYYAAGADACFAGLHVDHLTLEPPLRNLFEALVTSTANGLVEAFCGAFRVGHDDAGNSFHVELYEWDGPRQVVRYAEGAFTVFADSLDSLVYLAALHGAHRDDKISDDALHIGMRKLAGKVASTGLEPKRRDTEFLFYRSRWITALLQSRIGEVAAAFDADFNQIVPADQLAARYDACEKLTPTALYAMWRAFLFDEPELARYLEIARRHKARIVRDAAALVDELRAGRKQFGTVTDVPAWLAAFRALDLDPRRAEERKREVAERLAAEQRAKNLANTDLDALEPQRWHELAWKWLQNGVAHRQLLARLDATSPTAAQLAELDSVREMERYDRGLALARIADELSPQLEAVLAGVLVRDDNLADALPVFVDRDGDDEAPGWAAIDRALAPIYKATEPHAHFGTTLPYSLGGNDPIHGISVYLREDPPHFHFITYGFSDLFQKETQDPETSGFGFELTFRLARAPDETNVPAWAMDLLQNLGRYVFGTGNRFSAGHKLGWTGPIAEDRPTELQALLFVEEPELGEISSQFGKAVFLQIVGITADEFRLTQEWSTTGLYEIMKRRMPLLVTDIARKSVLADAATSIVVKKRVELEGSSEPRIRALGLAFEGSHVTIDREDAAALPRAMRGRIKHGRTYAIEGNGVTLELVPGEPAAIDHGDDVLRITVSKALADEILARVTTTEPGVYRFETLPELVITVAEPPARSIADDEDEADDDEPLEPEDEDEDPPPSPERVRHALSLTRRALALSPDDGDVQFTHAMLLLDGDFAGLDTLDPLIAMLPQFSASVRINVATRMSRADHPRFDEVVDAVLSDVLPDRIVGERAFSVGNAEIHSYGDVAEELFAELAEAILIHVPNRMAKLIPVLPANVTLLAKIAHDAIQADERDTALALYDRVLTLPVPEDGAQRINYLRSLNNACIQAHAVKAFDAASRIADRAQPYAAENPYIYHSAACAYAAVGDLAKAFQQVKLAVEHDYEHLEKVEIDRDLGALLDWPEFKALFRDWHARQEGN